MNKTALLIPGVIVLSVASGALWVTLQRNHDGLASRAVSTQAPKSSLPSSSGASTSTRQGYFYIASADSETDTASYQPHTIDLDDPRRPAGSVLRAMVQSDASPLPKGTDIRSVKIKDGLATVDFSREITQFHGGDSDEAQAVNSILATLGQFSTIDRVQITVEGKAIDTLGGHFDISEPLDVIRPESSRGARSPT